MRTRFGARQMVAAALIGVAACTGRDRARADSSMAAGASARGEAAGASSGVFVDGDERSEWTAVAEGDGMRIEQSARFGDDGTASRRYHYDDSGRLAELHEERSSTVLSGNQSPAVMRTVLTIDFRSTPPAATKTVDGAPAAVQPFEIDNARRRGDALRQLAPR